MSIQPQGEDLRKAVKWASDERMYTPGKELKAIIDEACMRFDLSPKEAEFLRRTLLEKE